MNQNGQWYLGDDRMNQVKITIACPSIAVPSRVSGNERKATSITEKAIEKG
ncbi:hypothetical protein [Cecembia calidifontis]|uniref:Uncharacterized protein n=1 Tax=Cecembia calidifontis TaxID=1187080 RepID=A0A4Q7P8Q8_9BACT|nr:hypothetical protein [Cecembia calidifontis]RZS96495.1 hypothetical protein BC751_2069 [Cecembia calidifontis]